MGLFDRLEANKINGTVWEPMDFSFESMSDEAIEGIIKFYKRLLLRGYEFDRGVLNLNSRVWICNSQRNIFFFPQGHMDGFSTRTNEEEYYYCLIYYGEMWSVRCIKSYSYMEGSSIKSVDVLYYPEKLGRESGNEAAVRNVAYKAMEFLSDCGGTEYYADKLREILGEDSVSELVYLKESWYDVIFDDTYMQKLMETKEESTRKQQDTPIFEIEAVTEVVYTNYFSNLELKLSGPYCFRPKVCVVNRHNEMRCFKPLPTEDLSGGIQEFDNYILVKENNVFVAQVQYIAEMNTLLISKIMMSGSMNMEKKQFLNNIVAGVKAIEEIYRYEPVVDCSEQLELISDKDQMVL